MRYTSLDASAVVSWVNARLLTARHPAVLSLPAWSLAWGLSALAVLDAAPAHAQAPDLYISQNDSNRIVSLRGENLSSHFQSSTTDLAFDASGDLFSIGSRTILEYPSTGPDTFGTAKSIDSSNPPDGGIAFDKFGNLFASTGDTINEYAATGAGTFAVPVAVLTGLDGAFRIAFDKNGDLFTSEVVGVSSSDGRNSITEFAAGTVPGMFGPAITIATGLRGTNGLAFDPLGNLYVTNYPDPASIRNGSVLEFMAGTLPGTFGPATTVASSLYNPLGLTSDALGNLFVANGLAGTVTELPRGAALGTFGPGIIVATNLSDPGALAFGPGAPVPEASTVVSFGLLLALGVGGLLVAARRKKARSVS